jgi:hypothetical protein
MKKTMWNPSEKTGPGPDPGRAEGPGGRSGRTSARGGFGAGRPARCAWIAHRAAGGLLASALLWPGGVLAHCDPANGHSECPKPTPPSPTDPVPGPSDRPVANLVNKRSATGANGIRIKAEVVNQRYANGAQQKYLLVDATVRLPAPALGITGKAAARTAPFVLRFFRFGAAEAYAECTLEPRKITGAAAVYSLGLKANAAHTLLRFGHCDQPGVPGFDSVFPMTWAGDTARLEGPGGTVIAEFAPPLVEDVPLPGRNRKKPQPATAKLLEGGTYRIRK